MGTGYQAAAAYPAAAYTWHLGLRAEFLLGSLHYVLGGSPPPNLSKVVPFGRFEKNGLDACLPTQACYIRCTPECMEVARRAYDLAQKEGRSASRQVSPAQPALQALPPAAAQPPAAAAVQAAVAAAAAAAQQRQGVPLQAGVGQKPGGKVR